MCRLLGIYGYTDFWQEILIEFQKLANFGKNAPHGDGWGLAKSNEGNFAMGIVNKELESAYNSQKYLKAVNSLKKQPQILLCHLRKASPSIPINMNNVQPFFMEKWAFIHNGTIYRPESLFYDSSFIFKSSKSDSEYLFYYLLTKLFHKKKDERKSDAIISAISSIKTDFTSANCMLSDGKVLYIVSWSDKRQQNYYTLFYYSLQNCIIICSEPIISENFNGEKWIEIPNQSVLKISGSPPKIELIKNSN